jgi:hypothetical protein
LPSVDTVLWWPWLAQWKHECGRISMSLRPWSWHSRGGFGLGLHVVPSLLLIFPLPIHKLQQTHSQNAIIRSDCYRVSTLTCTFLAPSLQKSELVTSIVALLSSLYIFATTTNSPNFQPSTATSFPTSTSCSSNHTTILQLFSNCVALRRRRRHSSTL